MDLDADDRAFLERLPEDLRLEAERALRKIESKNQREMEKMRAQVLLRLEKQCAALRTVLGTDQDPVPMEEVEEALKRLPLPPGADVQLAALKIERHFLVIRCEASQDAQDGPVRSLPPDQLSRLSRALTNVYEAFKALDETALQQLAGSAGEKCPEIFTALVESRITAEVVCNAHEAARKEIRRGKPTKIQAHDCAALLASIYLDLTGKKPTRSTKEGREGGPFVALVERVFAIAGIDASASYAAREAMAEMRSAPAD